MGVATQWRHSATCL